MDPVITDWVFPHFQHFFAALFTANRRGAVAVSDEICHFDSDAFCLFESIFIDLTNLNEALSTHAKNFLSSPRSIKIIDSDSGPE